ncbi:MAG TPA: HAD family hydrolase [Xanthobacteraceae bacterium]|nr:HAD family hydrolase [Xanthobacteraceae bacterium]
MGLEKKLQIFDVEGTLIDCVRQSLICWREAFASHGYEFSYEQLHPHSGRDPDEMIRLLLPEPAADRLATSLKNAQGRSYRERYLPSVKPFPHVRALFEQIKRRGALTALATTCSKDELRHYCDVAEIADLVDHVACGEDVSREKPHPDLIDLVLCSAKIAPTDAAMFGDTPFDAQAGRRAAVTAIGVMSGGFTEPELKAAGCAAVYADASALLTIC